MNVLLTTLSNAGWKVTPREIRPLSFSPELRQRHPTLPEDYVRFLQAFTLCANATETAWFLSEEDYAADDLARKNASTFRWNEYEQMSLEAFEGNPAEEQAVRRFWDVHFPIALAVHSDYAYLALCTASNHFGSVVYGYGPTFEDAAEVVCPSFAEFARRFLAFVGSRADDVPREYRDFL